MSTHTKWLVLIVVAAGTSVAPLALADGMVFRSKAVIEGDVQPVEVGLQRGLIWRLPEALEVWIEPVYAWDGDDEAAWIIPLPALPEVAEGDPKVLDDLDALTAPTFLSFCFEPHCNADCTLAGCPPMGGGTTGSEGKSDDGSTAAVNDPESTVTRWASGTVGALAYEVISAAEGQGAVAWLDANGYAVGDGAAEALAALDTEGLFFFVARVAAPPEAGQSLAPVRFVFAPDVLPFYPVRLTASALPAESHLDVTLWLLSDVRLLPTNDETALANVGLAEITVDAYAASIETKLSAMSEGGFVVEYVGALAEARPNGITPTRVEPVDCGDGDTAVHPASCTDAWGAARCYYDLEDQGCGLLDPIDLASDLKQRVRGAETPYTVRLRGRLPAGTRATEWTFAGNTAYETHELDDLTGVYAKHLGRCYECPPAAGLFCEPAANRPSPPGPALLTLLAVLAVVAGMSTIRKAR